MNVAIPIWAISAFGALVLGLFTVAAWSVKNYVRQLEDRIRGLEADQQRLESHLLERMDAIRAQVTDLAQKLVAIEVRLAEVRDRSLTPPVGKPHTR